MMRRVMMTVLVGMLLSLAAGCAIGTPTPTAVANTPTIVPTPTTTITPFVGAPNATPAAYPSPTIDRNPPLYSPGTLRNPNWPVGTVAIASYAARSSVDVDIGAIVLTVPVPEGTTLTFYFAVPPQRGFAGRASFPVAPRVQSLQPGDAIRIVGITAGTVRVPPTEGNYTVVNINGKRLARNDEPLSG